MQEHVGVVKMKLKGIQLEFPLGAFVSVCLRSVSKGRSKGGTRGALALLKSDWPLRRPCPVGSQLQYKLFFNSLRNNFHNIFNDVWLCSKV